MSTCNWCSHNFEAYGQCDNCVANGIKKAHAKGFADGSATDESIDELMPATPLRVYVTRRRHEDADEFPFFVSVCIGGWKRGTKANCISPSIAEGIAYCLKELTAE